MTGRTLKRVGATLFWALVYLALNAAVKPGWLGDAVLLALFAFGTAVLWNWDSIAAGRREDRARKREQDPH